MHSLLLAALVAAAPPAEASLDRSCFSVMAELAEAEDPRARALGRIAAQYFLGRIDSADPFFDPAAAPGAPEGAERTRLVRRCADAMGERGRDLRALGEALAPPPRPTI